MMIVHECARLPGRREIAKKKNTFFSKIKLSKKKNVNSALTHSAGAQTKAATATAPAENKKIRISNLFLFLNRIAI